MNNEFSPSSFISELFVDEKISETSPSTGQKFIESREDVLDRLSGLLEDDFEVQEEEKSEETIMEKSEEQPESGKPQIFTKKEIFEEVVAYFDGDELAAGVWIDKYSLKNENGELLERGPDEMHRRLAKEFARIEKKYTNPLDEELIYNLLLFIQKVPIYNSTRKPNGWYWK